MQATATPNPFPASGSFKIRVYGGSPPFTYTPRPSPPNPPGVQVSPNGDTADVTVPEDTPSGTGVTVEVTDSSEPPQRVTVGSTVA